MKTRTLLLKMILAAAALILAGCQNPLEPPKTADTSSRSAPVGFGSVTIDLGSAVRQAGRTVYPGHAGLVYGYTFTKTGGEPQTLEPQGGSFTLEYGEWTVEVRAWLGAKTDANLAASGAATFTVNAATQTVAVELAGVTEAGTGTFKYRIQYPDGATVTSFTLVKFPELTDSVVLGAPATATAGGVTTITGTKSNVPAGYYFVTVMLERNGKAAGKNEVVHIYNKLASEYGTEAEPVVFVDTDFSAMTTLAENIWADGNLVSGDDENWYKFTATAAYLNASAQFSGTLLETEGVDVVVYDSDGIVAGGRTQLYKNSLSVYHAVTPGAVYYIKVTSFNPTRTGTYRIKGAGMAADTIPPAPVHNLTANMASGSVTLYWSNPDDADFDYTEITFTPPAAGGIASYTVPKPGASKTITGLTNNQQYSFTIKAVDTNGNRSAPGSISLTPRASASITRYHPVPAPGAPVVVKAYTYLGKKYVLAYLGEIQNVPVLYDPPLYNDGVNAAHHRIEETQSTAFTEERSIETTKAKTVTDSLVTDYGVEGRVTGTLGAGPAKLEGEIKAHWNQTNSQTVVTEEKIRNTYGTVFTTFFSRTEERNYEIPITSPVGWYRYTLFSTQDVYATLVFNGSNLDRVEYVILTRPSRAYKFDYATDAEGYDFGRNSTA
ncbi:MAG: DUF4959 domain-containing protein, partial [Treponema sp.]|nr:DUF4959 domain-containing protein [Treponema sp.]